MIITVCLVVNNDYHCVLVDGGRVNNGSLLLNYTVSECVNVSRGDMYGWMMQDESLKGVYYSYVNIMDFDQGILAAFDVPKPFMWQMVTVEVYEVQYLFCIGVFINITETKTYCSPEDDEQHSHETSLTDVNTLRFAFNL